MNIDCKSTESESKRMKYTIIFVLHRNHRYKYIDIAKVFSFDNISFVVDVFNQLFLSNESSICKASYQIQIQIFY